MGNVQAVEGIKLHAMLDKCQQETNLSFEEIDDFYKQFIEEFPSGHITQSVFTKKMVKKHGNMDVGDFARKLFECYDLDKNGEIDFREFLLTMHISSAGSVEQKLRWIFRLYDTDGDGELHNDEITEILKAFLKVNPVKDADNGNLAESWSREIFMALDKAGDDAIGFTEFVQGAKKTDVITKLMVKNPPVKKPGKSIDKS